MSTADDTPVLITRTRSADRFSPRPVDPEAEAEGSLVARNVLHTRKHGKSELTHNRVIAGDLPEWEPLPPGELLVQR